MICSHLLASSRAQARMNQEDLLYNPGTDELVLGRGGVRVWNFPMDIPIGTATPCVINGRVCLFAIGCATPSVAS